MLWGNILSHGGPLHAWGWRRSAGLEGRRARTGHRGEGHRSRRGGNSMTLATKCPPLHRPRRQARVTNAPGRGHWSPATLPAANPVGLSVTSARREPAAPSPAAPAPCCSCSLLLSALVAWLGTPCPPSSVCLAPLLHPWSSHGDVLATTGTSPGQHREPAAGAGRCCASAGVCGSALTQLSCSGMSK